MDRWTRIARNKLAELIRRDDFVSILAINNHSALLEFKNEGCRISGFGNVTWLPYKDAQKDSLQQNEI